MIYFTIFWEHLTADLQIVESKTEFCENFFKILTPQDIWGMVCDDNRCYHKGDDVFERVWKLLKSELKGFVLPEPQSICFHNKK